MYKSHYYTLNKVCPCKIGEDSIKKVIGIYNMSTDAASFVEELERQRIIGKKIWLDENENAIFITKVYACESGGVCPNNNITGKRCHCDHYNFLKNIIPNTIVNVERNFTGQCFRQCFN